MTIYFNTWNRGQQMLEEDARLPAFIALEAERILDAEAHVPTQAVLLRG